MEKDWVPSDYRSRNYANCARKRGSVTCGACRWRTRSTSSMRSQRSRVIHLVRKLVSSTEQTQRDKSVTSKKGDEHVRNHRTFSHQTRDGRPIQTAHRGAS